MLHQKQQCDIGLEDAAFDPQPGGGLYLGTWWWRWWPIPSENLIQHLFMFLCIWVSSGCEFVSVWGWGEGVGRMWVVKTFLLPPCGCRKPQVQILLIRRTPSLGRKFGWGYSWTSGKESLAEMKHGISSHYYIAWVVLLVHSTVENPILAYSSWKWFFPQTRDFFEALTLICP